MKVIFACLVLLAGNAICAEPKIQSVKDRVEKFCEVELKGDHAKRVEFFKRNIRDEYAVDFASEPVDLVNGYEIVSIRVDGDIAKVVVKYDLLGQLRNVRYSGYPGLKPRLGTWIDRADKLVVKHDPEFMQTIYWAYEPRVGDWFITSHQTPRVSVKAVLGLLRKSVDEKRSIINKNKGESLHHIDGFLFWDINKIKTIESMESLK